MGIVNRRIAVQAGLDINLRPYSKDNYNQKNWGCGSRDRLPV
jgi:hypothetical protein